MIGNHRFEIVASVPKIGTVRHIVKAKTKELAYARICKAHPGEIIFISCAKLPSNE